MVMNLRMEWGINGYHLFLDETLLSGSFPADCFFFGTETPAQDIRRQTHDPKPALPEIIQLDFTSRPGKMTGGEKTCYNMLNSTLFRAKTHHDPHEILPHWISLGTVSRAYPNTSPDPHLPQAARYTSVGQELQNVQHHCAPANEATGCESKSQPQEHLKFIEFNRFYTMSIYDIEHVCSVHFCSNYWLQMDII